MDWVGHVIRLVVVKTSEVCLVVDFGQMVEGKEDLSGFDARRAKHVEKEHELRGEGDQDAQEEIGMNEEFPIGEMIFFFV